jgi:hypothetical protein
MKLTIGVMGASGGELNESVRRKAYDLGDAEARAGDGAGGVGGVMAMIKPIVLANALAAVVGAGYVLCRFIAAVAPQFLFNVGQSWLHTVNLEPLRTTGSMSTGMFVLGLVTSMVVSWVVAYATAELYKLWAR